MTALTAAVSVARKLDSCTALGPGRRAVLWVQGCPLRCRGCVAAETLPFDGGTPATVGELAQWLGALPDIEGVTLSGGEPFAQAAALAALLDAVRERRPDFGAMAYSGFRHEALTRGTSGQRALLARLDLLIDGPYVAARHAPLLWRGSSNQRIHLLTDRYAALRDRLDTTAGIEFSIPADGTLTWAGVPPVPGFRAALEAGLDARGFTLTVPGPDPGEPGAPGSAPSGPGSPEGDTPRPGARDARADVAAPVCPPHHSDVPATANRRHA